MLVTQQAHGGGHSNPSLCDCTRIRHLPPPAQLTAASWGASPRSDGGWELSLNQGCRELPLAGKPLPLSLPGPRSP